jgi:hypothetical protein
VAPFLRRESFDLIFSTLECDTSNLLLNEVGDRSSGFIFSEVLKLFNSNFELRPISVIKDIVTKRDISLNVRLPLLIDAMSSKDYKQCFFFCVVA